MWCVAELNEEYISKMEDVLETYEKPYDAAEPVICLDEKPVTLHADVRPTSPAKPGREARRDNEYERHGTANVFCAVEPKAGRHFTFATPDRSAFAFARVVCELAMQYRDAATIHLVLDNLNIHCLKSLTDRDGPRGMGPLHNSLHPETRKLAQSGGNRNRPVLAAMPRETPDPRSEFPSPRNSRVEPSNEP